MARRDVAIEIFMPTEGLNVAAPSSMLSLRSTPYVRDANYFNGYVQKDFGTRLFCSGSGGVGSTLGAPITLLVETPFPQQTTLQAFTATGMYKYSGGLDALVVDGQTYTGSVTDYWSACVHNSALIYSNGIDLVQYKAAYNSTGTLMGGVSASSYKANVVLSFANHLNLYNVTEAGNNSPKRIQWTNVGLLGYTSTDWTAGTAGFSDQQDIDEKIMTAEKLGNDAVAIYGKKSIHLQYWVGGNDVYNFSRMIDNVGTPSRRGVVANGTVHYILSDDNIYEYAGGRDIKPIGDAIQPRYMQIVNHSALQYSFMEYIKEDDELRVHVPTATATHPDKVFICKIKDSYAWSEKDEPYVGKGVFTTPSALTIGELVGNIGAQNWKIGDLIARVGQPVAILGDLSGRVVQRDKTVYSLSISGTSSPQIFTWDSKDISSINDVDPAIKQRAFAASKYRDNESRWLQLKADIKGNGSLAFQYSVDGGISFTAFPESPVTLTSDWTMHELDTDIANPDIRIRAVNTGTNEIAHIRYVKLKFVPGGEVG